jgi:integrase
MVVLNTASGTDQITSLMMAAQRYVVNSVAPSTRNQYSKKFNSYNNFCSNTYLATLPITQEKLIMYSTYLADHISHQSIKGHLSAIKYFALIHGQDTDFTEFQRLHRLLKGIKRVQAQKFSKPKRLPITPPILHTFYTNLSRSPLLYEDKLMLWAAMLTAFFGFLRVSEYTSLRVRSHDPAVNLCHSDVFIRSPNVIDIRIKASKTDPFRIGTIIRLTRNFSTLCPVQALLNYLQNNSHKSGPLFTFHDGRFLTRRTFAAALNKLKPAHINNLSSHSFRIGAATTAAAAGHPRWLIQALGRWSSDCYKTYLRISDHTKSLVSQSLAHTFNTGPTFDPDNINH